MMENMPSKERSALRYDLFHYKSANKVYNIVIR